MTKQFRAIITDFIEDPSIELELLGDMAEVKTLVATHEEEILQKAPDADVLMVHHMVEITDQTIAKLSHCRGIVRYGVGYDNVDIKACGRHGIVVCNVPDYGSEEVADHSLMLLLVLARRFVPIHKEIQSGVWDPGVGQHVPRLRGKTLGIIGCGRIGTAFALRAKALGLKVVFYDPYQPVGYEKAIGVERTYSLDELLPCCDFLSLHCPLTEDTRGIINRESLAKLPNHACVINTARGPCIDQNALLEALNNRKIAWAALDVIEKEPLADEELRLHPRIVLTPHAAFYSNEGNRELRTKGALEVRRMLCNEPVRSPVNLGLLHRPRYSGQPVRQCEEPAGS